MDFIEAVKGKLQELISKKRKWGNPHHAVWLRNAKQPDDARDNDDEDQELPLRRSNVQTTRACSPATEMRFRSLCPPFISIEVLVFWVWKSRLRRRRGVNMLWRG